MLKIFAESSCGIDIPQMTIVGSKKAKTAPGGNGSVQIIAEAVLNRAKGGYTPKSVPTLVNEQGQESYTDLATGKTQALSPGAKIVSFPNDAVVHPAEQPKRGRGRPKKTTETSPAEPKKGRGRPKKTAESAPTEPKKGKGRSKKTDFVGPINQPNKAGRYAAVALSGELKDNDKKPLTPKAAKTTKDKIKMEPINPNDFVGPINKANKAGRYTAVALSGEAKDNDKKPLAPKAVKAAKEKVAKTAKAVKEKGGALAIRPPSQAVISGNEAENKPAIPLSGKGFNPNVKGLLPPDKKFTPTDYGAKFGVVIPRSARAAAKAAKEKGGALAIRPSSQAVISGGEAQNTSAISLSGKGFNPNVKGLLPADKKFTPTDYGQQAGPAGSKRLKAKMSGKVKKSGKEMGLAFKILHPKFAKGTAGGKGGEFRPKGAAETVVAQLKALNSAKQSGAIGGAEFERLRGEIAKQAHSVLSKVDTPQARQVAAKAKVIADQGASAAGQLAAAGGKAVGKGIAKLADVATRPEAIQAYKKAGSAVGDAALGLIEKGVKSKRGQRALKSIGKDVKTVRKAIKKGKDTINSGAINVARNVEKVKRSPVGQAVAKGGELAKRGYEAATSDQAKQIYGQIGDAAKAAVNAGKKVYEAVNSEQGQAIDRAIKSSIIGAGKKLYEVANSEKSKEIDRAVKQNLAKAGSAVGSFFGNVAKRMKK